MIQIAEQWLRVEYAGDSDMPARLVVPLIFEAGKHKNVRLRVTPRDGIRLGQSIETGNALQQTFSRGWTSTAGASFFGSASVARANSVASSQYGVFLTPDFRTVIFELRQFEAHEKLGIQVAFVIDAYEPNPAVAVFAEVELCVDDRVVARATVPQEVHPRAAGVAVIAGFHAASQPRAVDRHLGPCLSRPKILHEPSTSAEVCDFVAEGCDILHLECVQVDASSFTLENRVDVSISDLFAAVDRGRVGLIVLASCNSVAAVTKFRQSRASALVAATENLYTHYWDFFEIGFYGRLAVGKSVTEAFAGAREDATDQGLTTPSTFRSGTYEPMFLDLKSDLYFGAKLLSDTREFRRPSGP